MATRAKKANAPVTVDGPQWTYGIRTWDKNGKAHGGFQWDLTEGARNEAPDWRPTVECGNGLHCNPEGLGDWSLLSPDPDSIIGIVRYDAKLAVDLDGKVKAPFMEIVATSQVVGRAAMMQRIAKITRDAVLKTVADGAKTAKTTSATKKQEHASAAGDRGHASAAGDRGHASAAGDSGHASAAGDSGHASAAGDSGHASAAGDRGHASAAGDSGHASAAGDSGHASAAGDRGHASAAGDSGHASAAGYSGHASAAGDRGHASAAGDSGHASAAGDSGHASAAGYSGHASAAGDRGHASAAGDRGHASAAGKYGVSAALGINSTAQAGESGALLLTAWKQDKITYEWSLVAVFAGMVGQTYGLVTIKPNTPYRLGEDGAPVEVVT